MNTSDYRKDFAAFSSALELAHYRHRAGFEPELHSEPIYERYSDLFTPEAIQDLQRALEDTPAHLDTERAGLGTLLGAARVGYMEARVRELTDECAHCQSGSQVEWDGERVALNSVPKMLANEGDVRRRHELGARWVDAISRCNDLRAARLESFHASAVKLGFDSYAALYEDIMVTDLELLAAQTDDFLRRTESVYTAALRKTAARDVPGVGFDELDYSDYLFFQRLVRLDPFFPARGVMPTYAAAMSGLGIRVEQQKNIHIDAELRPTKNPRAACFRINPPEDVRLLVAPVGGVYDYTVLFHEVGHAQHFAWSSNDLVKRYPEFLYAPDHATMESYAFLLNYLYLDPLWLREYLPNVREENVREIRSTLSLLTLHNVRRYAGKLRYELEMHTASNLRSEQLAERYAALQTEATLFRRDPALYLWDVDDGFYAASYLRAWAFEIGLREHLLVRHGRRWWQERRAGDELIDLWNTASRYTVEELARLVGFGELDFDLLADHFIKTVSEV